jgi:hypothetical protein
VSQVLLLVGGLQFTFLWVINMTGFLIWCGDSECDCWQPVIVDDNAVEIWRGRFLEKPTESEKEGLRQELRDKAMELGNVIITSDVTYKGT